MKLATNYANRLNHMIKSFRQDVQLSNLPVVIGELGQFLDKPHKHEIFRHWEVVNSQIRMVPQLVNEVAFVSSDGLIDRGDAIHFNSVSADELGERYAEALNRIR